MYLCTLRFEKINLAAAHQTTQSSKMMTYLHD